MDTWLFMVAAGPGLAPLGGTGGAGLDPREDKKEKDPGCSNGYFSFNTHMINILHIN
jgi:hypothetical protein